ncbi:acyl-CoA dehydrogenase family protein [Arthrobacter alpinus]|nr:acyl-CoA dehydrogenase family protein [Arthrobacter alpinus]
MLIFEELAAVDPTIAAYISIHNMVAWMIDAFGNQEQRAAWLPGITAMTELTSYCLSEPGVGSDAAAITTRAVRDGEDYILNGTKQFISGAGSSAWYLVMVRTADKGARGSPRSWFRRMPRASVSVRMRRKWAGGPNPPAKWFSRMCASRWGIGSAKRAMVLGLP